MLSPFSFLPSFCSALTFWIRIRILVRINCQVSHRLCWWQIESLELYFIQVFLLSLKEKRRGKHQKCWCKPMIMILLSRYLKYYTMYNDAAPPILANIINSLLRRTYYWNFTIPWTCIIVYLFSSISLN